jgi:hypothetical protein
VTAVRRTEALLAEAAAAAAWPATPDLRGPVLARIEAGGDLRAPVLARIAGTRPEPVARSGSLVRRPILRSLALAVVAVVAVAGVAGALGYRLPGFDLVFVETLPPAGTALDLGSPVPLADAQAVERPRVLLPAALPAPTTAWILGAGDRRIVTLAWRAEPGQETLEGSDLALTLMAVAGTTDEAFIKKALDTGTTVESVDIGGDRGWWISGLRHAVMFLRPDGGGGVLTSALAGDTLVFARDGTLYRLESALGRDATIAIAESLP